MFRYYLAPIAWAAIILFLSIIPSSELPEFSLWRIFSFDKLVHAAMYGALTFQIMKALIRQYANWTLRYNAARISFITSTIYGGLIELYQEFLTPDRYGDWMDLISNIIGAIIGIILFRIIFIEYIR